VSRADHEGFELRIPTRPLVRTTTRSLGATLALLAPVTAVTLALPGAVFVQWLGWWLVNEVVLVERWLLAGVPITVATFAAWLLLHPRHQVLRVSTHTLRVGRFPGLPVTIRFADLDRATWDGDARLQLHLRGGGRLRIELRGLEPPQQYALAEAIRERIHQARRVGGSPEAVPEELDRMRGNGARQEQPRKT
jgi:hypothetical protein